jgi:hypothetical protein
MLREDRLGQGVLLSKFGPIVIEKLKCLWTLMVWVVLALSILLATMVIGHGEWGAASRVVSN